MIKYVVRKITIVDNGDLPCHMSVLSSYYVTLLW